MLVIVDVEVPGLHRVTFCFYRGGRRKKSKKILPPGVEPGTYRVLGGRHNHLDQGSSTAVSRIRTGVVAATKRSTNHYTNTACCVGLVEPLIKFNTFWTFANGVKIVYKKILLERIELSTYRV